jgi:hypothetical protein
MFYAYVINIPRYKGSLVTAIQRKSKHIIHVVTMLLFYIVQQERP